MNPTDAPARGRLAVAACVACALAALGAWALLRPEPAPPPGAADAGARPGPPAPAPRAEVRVRVWSEEQGRYRDAAPALPLAAGARVRFEADAPAGRHLTLFAAYPSGEVRQLAAAGPRAEAGTIRYPEGGEAAPLDPPAGTVVVLLCGRAGAPTVLNEARAALGAGPWPHLPPRSLLALGRDQVEVFGGRGSGPPAGRTDPEGEALRRLDAARAWLRGPCDVLAGVAFSYK